jgi:hypothetical protein
MTKEGPCSPLVAFFDCILSGLPRFMRYADVFRECFIDCRLYVGKERILAYRAAL